MSHDADAPTLTRLLEERLRQPDPLLIDRGHPYPGARLADESARLASALAAMGVQHGDRVALWLPNVPAWLACFFACARLGAIAVAVNTRFRAHEVADIVSRSGARVLVTWPDFPKAPFLPILAQCPASAMQGVHDVICYDERGAVGSVGDALLELPEPLAHARVHRYADLLRHEPMRAVHGRAGDGCAIFTTSGTTKAPKFVLHSQRNLVLHAEQVVEGFGFDATSSLLLAPPLCGIFGATSALSILRAGRPFVMMPVWDAAFAADLIDRFQITHCNATDEAIAQLLACNTRTPAFPSLRFSGYAAFTPALVDIAETADRRGLPMVGLYGISEIQALFSRFDHRAPLASRRNPGGFLVGPRARVRACDPDTGEVLPHGRAGELQFIAPDSIMMGYFGNEEATRAAFTADGWYRSGDLGFTSADGSFEFQTRLGDSLRLGGFLVSPLEIEECVQQVPGISGCQVCGATIDGSLRPVAFVLLEAGATLDEEAVRAHVTGQLARYKVPARVFALDAFPVTEGTNATKIQKHRLRDLAQELLAAGA